MKKLYCIRAYQIAPSTNTAYSSYLEKVVSVSDPNPRNSGLGLLSMTFDIDKAMTFPSFKRAKEAAMVYFKGKKWEIEPIKVAEQKKIGGGSV